MTLDSIAAPPIPNKFHLTVFIILLNCLLYIIISIKGGPSIGNLIAFGAKENGLIAEGQLFRLISPLFLHGSFLILILNMFILFQMGRVLEQLVGFQIFILIYIISGITGNTASFFLNDGISFGASGSVFGVLTCLWVIEKYTTQFEFETNQSNFTSSLGSIIIAWSVISFIIPQLDWTSHLGGAIAGFLLGKAYVLNFEENMRLLNAIRYVLPSAPLPKKRNLLRPKFYIFSVFILNLVFVSKMTSIPFSRRVYGLGYLEASLDGSENRKSHYLKQFSPLFSSKKSEINISNLLLIEKSMILKSNWRAAIPLSKALISLHKTGVGDEDFLSKSTLHLLVETLEMSNNEEINQNLIESIEGELFNSYDEKKICHHAGELMANLSFYSLSAKFYECAFYITSVNDKIIGSKIVKSYIKSKKFDELNRFLIQLEFQNSVTSNNHKEEKKKNEFQTPI